MPENEKALFAEFTAPTYAEWYATAVKSLKGKPFEKLISKTYEGIEIQPIYTQADTADLDYLHSIPGQQPYVRGTAALQYVSEPWLVAQEASIGDPALLNVVLQHDLERGQTAINILLDRAARAGIDPDQSEAGFVGVDGVSVATVVDLQTLFSGIDLAATPLFVRAGTVALPFAALLAAYLENEGVDTAVLSGTLEADPIAELARRGSLPLPLETAYAEIADLMRWAANHAPDLAVMTLHGYPYAHGGANVVQELAFVLATAVTYMRTLQALELDINIIARSMQFAFALGGDFFMEIAKLRAARLLWTQIVAAFGGDAEAQKMRIHGRSSRWNKTQTDAYVNMLRATTEAFSGAIGGVNSMHVAPVDEEFDATDEFSRRIARNVQIILQEEAGLTHLVDPAGGAYYIEYLTDQVAQKAWALFQEIEGQGGMLAALQNGFVQGAVAETAVARQKNLAKRKDVLVGTNMYANLDEKKPAPNSPDYAAIYAKRAAEVAAYRQEKVVSDYVGGGMETAVALAQKGATLGQITKALRADYPTNATPTINPIYPQRGGQPFEALRANAEKYAAANGQRPQIFLANMGSLGQYKARADFTTGFFEVGGFEIINPPGFETPKDAAEATLASGAEAVVICSADDNYPAVVPELVAQLKTENPDMVVVLAGYPKDQIAAHQAAGVDEFIFLGADCYAINAWLLTKVALR